MHYTLKDHQGSLTATVCGNTVERLSYDAWGRRRNPVGFSFFRFVIRKHRISAFAMRKSLSVRNNITQTTEQGARYRQAGSWIPYGRELDTASLVF